MNLSKYIPNIGSKDRASDGSEAASHDCMDFRPTNKKILLIPVVFLFLAPAGGRNLHPTEPYPITCRALLTLTKSILN